VEPVRDAVKAGVAVIAHASTPALNATIRHETGKLRLDEHRTRVHRKLVGGGLLAIMAAVGIATGVTLSQSDLAHSGTVVPAALHDDIMLQKQLSATLGLPSAASQDSASTSADGAGNEQPTSPAPTIVLNCTILKLRAGSCSLLLESIGAVIDVMRESAVFVWFLRKVWWREHI
jgi:hypothetical protein